MTWSFTRFDSEFPEGLKDLKYSRIAGMHRSLGDYELQTIGEIWGPADNGCREYEVASAHENIRKRLIDLAVDDQTHVHSLRITGKFRVLGYLDARVFKVLWIDPDHEMWPSEKKHT